MKDFNSYIVERLKLSNKHTIKQDSYEKQLFKEYYKGIPETLLDYIFDTYVEESPFSEECNKVLLCTAFELLYMIGAMLIYDGYDSADDWQYYKKMGYKKYLNKKGNKGSNPYDFAWFEEEFDNTDILSYLQNEWIPNNENEFIVNIWEVCKKYKNILSIDRVYEFYSNVFDK